MHIIKLSIDCKRNVILLCTSCFSQKGMLSMSMYQFWIPIKLKTCNMMCTGKQWIKDKTHCSLGYLSPVYDPLLPRTRRTSCWRPACGSTWCGPTTSCPGTARSTGTWTASSSSPGIELSTNLRKVSECPEKGPTKAFSSALIIKTLYYPKWAFKPVSLSRIINLCWLHIWCKLLNS